MKKRKQCLFTKWLDKRTGVNQLLYDLLDRYRKIYNLSYCEALYFIIQLLKEGYLPKEDIELLNKWLLYQKLRIKDKINSVINRVAKQEAKRKNIKELIRNEYKRQKTRGIDKKQIIKFLKDYFLNEDYLKNYNYSKEQIKKIIIEVIKEEDKDFYLYLLEQQKGDKNEKQNTSKQD